MSTNKPSRLVSAIGSTKSSARAQIEAIGGEDPIAGGDLGGTYDHPIVTGISGLPVNTVVPGIGEVLAWDGSQWVPVVVGGGGPPSGGAGGSLTGLYPNPTIANGVVGSLQLDPTLFGHVPTSDEKDALAGTSGTPSALNLFVTNSDTRLTDARAPNGVSGGDLSGSYPSPTVAAIQGGAVSVAAPTDGYVLTWNGSNSWWEPAVIGSSPPDGAAGGSLAGSYPNPTIAAGAVGSVELDPTLYSSVPTGDEKDALVGTSGTPSSLNVFVTDSDARMTNSRTPSGAASGDLSGTYPAPVVAALQGNPVGAVAPTVGQVLTWTGSAWVPGAAATGGSGGGGVLYYLRAGAAAMAPTVGIPALPFPTKQLDTSAEIGGTTITSAGLLATVWTPIVGFLTNVNKPYFDAIPAGIWDFNVWASSSDLVPGATQFRVRLYHYDGTNPPTLVVTAQGLPLFEPGTIAQYTVSVAVGQTPIALTDRIYVVLEAYANTLGTTFMFSFGDGVPTHAHTTFPSVAGTGIVHVLNGAAQSPASPIDLAAGSTEITGVLPVANGGTGVAVSPTNGQLLIGNGSGFTTSTLTAGTAISITNGVGAITVNSTGVTSVDVSGGGTGLTTSGGPITTTGTVTLDGLLNVGHGGTGLAVPLTNGQLLIGNGTGFTASTLTAGAGIGITNGVGTIAINSTGVVSVGATAPLASSGGTSPTLSLNDIAPSPAGSYTSANITVDVKGRVTAAANGGANLGTVIYSTGAAQLITLVASTINPTATYHRVRLTGGITLTSVPTINWGSPVLGQVLILQLTLDSVGSLTLTRGLARKLSLGTGTRQLSAGGTISLMYDGTVWVETSFTASTSAP